MKLLVLGTLASLAVAFGVQAQANKSADSCFWTRDLRNHTIGDAHTLYFDLGGRSVYRVTMSGSCLAGAVSSDPIVMVNRTGTGQICNKLDLDIRVRGVPCIVSDLSKLTPQEAAALPKRVKP
jgi:hypothetical protein